MKYDIAFGYTIDNRFFRQTPKQIQRFMETRSKRTEKRTVEIEERIMGGDSFTLNYNPDNVINLTIHKKIRGVSEKILLATISNNQLTINPISPKDFELVKALTASYMNEMYN